MLTKLYTIYDKVACIFNKPFTEVNNNTAIRAFTNSIMESKNITDYDLYKIGEYDDNTGEIIPNTPEKIHTGFSIASQLVE